MTFIFLQTHRHVKPDMAGSDTMYLLYSSTLVITDPSKHFTLQVCTHHFTLISNVGRLNHWE